MGNDSKSLVDRLDFIEFRQNIFFLKPPHHNSNFFYDLTLQDFLKIREFAEEYSLKIKSNEPTSLSDFEKNLINIWQPTRSYPLLASLFARVLMDKDIYAKLIA